MGYSLYETGSFSNYGNIIGAGGGIEFTGAGSYLRNISTAAGSGTIAGNAGVGVNLYNGGAVYNGFSAFISGSTDGISAGQSATVVNHGNIDGQVFGVALAAGGYVGNSFGGIFGGSDGVVMTGYGTVNDSNGVISGSQFAGIFMNSGGAATVGQFGSVYGGAYGIYFTGASGSVTNAGFVGDNNRFGGSGANTGVALRAGGAVTNSGTIAGGSAGVYSYANVGSGFVVNSGLIQSYQGRGAGVYLRGSYILDTGGGDVFNNAGGTITGYKGVDITHGGYVRNDGSISGTGTSGVYIKGGGVVVNQAGGSIRGATYGVNLASSYSSVSNYGTIGGQTAVQLSYSGNVSNFGGTISGSNTGVFLRAGGSVFNQVENGAVGSIYGTYYGVLAEGAAAQISNAGSIRSFYKAVNLLAGGSVTNSAGGYIGGFGGSPGEGILIQGGVGTVVNSGSIVGAGYAGVSLAAGGNVTNATGGRISGATDGVALSVSGTVSNAGVIAGTGGGSSGVYLAGGGRVANFVHSTISGQQNGVLGVGAAVNLANSGTIIGTSGDGVLLAAGGTVFNGAAGTISGNTIGLLVSGGNATVTTSGKISGGSFAVKFTGGGTDTLVIDPGAAFGGTVSGAGAISTLRLAAGAGTGFIAGLGSQFTGFKTIDVDAGALWSVTGVSSLASTTTLNDAGLLNDTGRLTAAGPVIVSGTLRTAGTGVVQLRNELTLQSGSSLATSSAGAIEIGTTGGATHGVVTVDAGAKLTGAGRVASAVVDKGSITAQGGTLAFSGKVSGSGTLNLGPNATVSVGGALSVSKLVFLAGGSETAVLGAPTAVSSTISGFRVTTDTLDLKGFVANGLHFAGHTLTVDRAVGGAAHLTFAGSYTTSQFAFATDHHGGTNITFV